MITFILCLALLVISYFTYAKYLERTCEVKGSLEVPSKTHYDGVDYCPLPKWKTFLIQLLNIAGLGPIFGAVLGAAYGPVAFLWITFGGIFFGAMHDYVSGMISIKHNGLSLPEIIGHYLGGNVKQFMRVFTILLMVLVGAVFMKGPADILGNMTGWNPNIWLYIILVYYILATLLPVDKIIGKIYPVFGASLMFMALGILAVLLSGRFELTELTSIQNMKFNASDFPLIPTMFVTIACGAISGFHATQSPLMARCVTNDNQGRPVFFGAMIAESIIAMIWAAAGMAFFGGVDGLNGWLASNGGNAAVAVDIMSKDMLGFVGGMLALIGVVVAPITSGDTAFRSARLIVADFIKVEQKTLIKRIYICIPLFVLGFAITQMPFDVIWRYFAWANQTLAMMTLWMIAVYLFINKKNVIIAIVPAVFMTFICMLYFFVSREMLHLDYSLGVVLAIVTTFVIAGAFTGLLTEKKNG